MDRVVWTDMWWEDAEGSLVYDSHGLCEVGGRGRRGAEFGAEWRM